MMKIGILRIGAKLAKFDEDSSSSDVTEVRRRKEEGNGEDNKHTYRGITGDMVTTESKVVAVAATVAVLWRLKQGMRGTT